MKIEIADRPSQYASWTPRLTFEVPDAYDGTIIADYVQKMLGEVYGPGAKLADKDGQYARYSLIYGAVLTGVGSVFVKITIG